MDTMYDFQDVLMIPQKTSISSRKQVNLEMTYTFPFSNKTWTGVPICASNMDTVGTLSVYQVLHKHKMLTFFHKFHTIQDFQQFEQEQNTNIDWKYGVLTTGIREKDLERTYSILNTYQNIQWLCIDVPNGYIDSFLDVCRDFRMKYPNLILIAGNVVTLDLVECLGKDIGIDVIKVGIGSGSACLTRKQTGCGIPQFSAIQHCTTYTKTEKEMNKIPSYYIMSDGGITCPGDVVKAFGAGADFVMIGGQFAGHEENPGDIVETIVNGKSFQEKVFYGMSSDHAMKQHYGKMDSYRSSEGRVLRIPYKGPMELTIQHYLGGIRSGMVYNNAHTLDQLSKHAKFVHVYHQLNTIYAK
jgi:GMP reductase